MDLLSAVIGGLIVLSPIGIIKLVSYSKKLSKLNQKYDVILRMIESLSEEMSENERRRDNTCGSQFQTTHSDFSREVERLENLINVNRQNVERRFERELTGLNHRMELESKKPCSKDGGCKPGGCKLCKKDKK